MRVGSDQQCAQFETTIGQAWEDRRGEQADRDTCIGEYSHRAEAYRGDWRARLEPT